MPVRWDATVWDDSVVRATRLIYVENDPALRGILSRALAAAPGIELIATVGTAAEALDAIELRRADAALLDLALGQGEPNGVDLRLAIRERDCDIGIVIYSQHSLRNMRRRVPDAQAMGWSFFPKSGDMDVDDLVEVIRATARGGSQDRMDAQSNTFDISADALDELTPRQRAVMALAATGLTAPEIAKRLAMSHDSVRKDLSRTYRLLVPNADGGDLRTMAVLAYLRLMHDPRWEEAGA